MEETAGYFHQHQNQANPSKFYINFLYKAIIVTIFLIIIPLFPSQAPEFINQTLNSRGWEFLHLVFVGIALSYGLFSRRNDETEKETNSNQSKFDNAQSYMSRFLQVSSFFDDEVDSPPRSDGEKMQTWSNQYYRNEPAVVVADQEHRVATSKIAEKPLLLPVRSLKSRIADIDVNETSKESNIFSGSIRRSSSDLGFKSFSSNYQELEENLKDNVVLPSPIPWRSRSGRMEMKEADSPPLYTLPPSMEEPEFNRSFRTQVSRSSRPNSATSSPKLSPLPSMSWPHKHSPSPSPSSETQGKSSEDFVRKKSFYRSPPPPPPPPPLSPPPRVIRKASSMKPRTSAIDDDEDKFVSRELKRSYTSELLDLNSWGNFPLPKSVRTIRSNNSLAGAEKISKVVEASALDRTGRQATGFDQRVNRESVTLTPQPTYGEFPEEQKEEFVKKFEVEFEDDLETEEEEADDDVHISRSSAVSHVTIGTSNSEEEAGSSSASDGGPDVDKKADEFIAKFREQIRLQRIDSIKRSSAQISRKAAR